LKIESEAFIERRTRPALDCHRARRRRDPVTGYDGFGYFAHRATRWLAMTARAGSPNGATPADQLSSALQTQNLDLNRSNFQSSILLKFNRWIELIRG
jgi:hypothetical protein